MQAVDDLIRAYGHLALFEANEAETRYKLIDRVLFEVLGWTRDDVSVEERVSEDGAVTFVDFIVRTAGSAFIIEAKRVGTAFSTVPNVRRRKLSGALMEGDTGRAITQARDYSRKKSIPFAVVTNGAQWIVFPATRIDQVAFSESSAVIFPSLESALRDDYSGFMQLLSRDAVITGSLDAELLGRTDDQVGDRRLRASFTNRGTGPARNPLYPLIEDAIVTAFTDSIVDSSPELLAKCYVQTPDRVKFDRQIRMYISKRQPVFSRPAKPMQKKDSTALRDAIAQSRIAARPIAILILGPVGVGKTTFIHYTRNVSSSEFFSVDEAGPYPHWIYVDFRDFQPSIGASTFLYRAVREYAANDRFLSNYEQCVRPAFIEQIRALREGPLKPIGSDETRVNERITDFLLEQQRHPEYIDRIVSYGASKAPVFIVVDNIDQLATDELQSSVFTECMAFAHRNRLNLVLSLREATYVQHRTAPVFDAFDFAPISIESPAIAAVLSKRFFLAKQILSGRSGNFIAENGARVEVSDLATIADLISSSVLGTNIGSIIDVLATSDVRLALRMTREFLESGYSNPGRAVTVYQSEGRYRLPPHEALRSVLLGNQPVYREELSIIGNPLDARLGKTTHQLLRLFVLTAMVTLSSRADFRYIEGADIRSANREVGFGDAATEKVLTDLCSLRFIFTAAHGEASLLANFYPSRLGGYIVRSLLGDMTYLEAVMMDTFISDTKTWTRLRQLSENIESERDIVKRLKLRIERIRAFYAHMRTEYSKILSEATRRALPTEWCVDPFDNASSRLDTHITWALRSADRNYGPEARNNPRSPYYGRRN
jgi:GTPase SAR1 family protein